MGNLSGFTGCIICGNELGEGRLLTCSPDCYRQFVFLKLDRKLYLLDAVRQFVSRKRQEASAKGQISRTATRFPQTCAECEQPFLDVVDKRKGGFFCSTRCEEGYKLKITQHNKAILPSKRHRQPCKACGKCTFGDFCDNICKLMYDKGIRY